LPLRALRRLYWFRHVQIEAADPGEAWEVFRANMARMRKAGHRITYA